MTEDEKTLELLVATENFLLIAVPVAVVLGLVVFYFSRTNRAALLQKGTTVSKDVRGCLKNVRRCLGVCAIVGISGLAGAAAKAWVKNTQAPKTPTYDRVLVEVCDRMNKKLPSRVGNFTLDAAVPGPGKQLSYFLSMPNASWDQVDAKEFVRKQRMEILAGYRSHADMKAFRDNGVTVIYHYRDKNGRFIEPIRVSAGDL